MIELAICLLSFIFSSSLISLKFSGNFKTTSPWWSTSRGWRACRNNGPAQVPCQSMILVMRFCSVKIFPECRSLCHKAEAIRSGSLGRRYGVTLRYFSRSETCLLGEFCAAEVASGSSAAFGIA